MSDRPRLDLRSGTQRVFAHVVASSLAVSVANFTVWFAVTFWVYLETRSVFATGLIAGVFLVATAATGTWFGSLVDHHRKHAVIQASAVVSCAFYAIALGLYLLLPEAVWQTAASPMLWVFVVVLMLGVIAGNIRAIALPTLVTLLMPEPLRDRANGLVGTTSGVSFLVTSVISGLLVAFDGMRSTIILAMAVSVVSFLHLASVPIAEPEAVTTGDAAERGVDLRGTLQVVRGVPGLLALIAFSCFNNFIGGAFIAVMDPYGLSLVSVQAWGLLWGVLSAAVIIGGLLITRTGVGANPVRTLLLVNIVLWTACIVFPLRSSVVLLVVALLPLMLVMPYAEAAEQTILPARGALRHRRDRRGRDGGGPAQPPLPATIRGVPRQDHREWHTRRPAAVVRCHSRRSSGQTATSATSAASAVIRAQSPAATASAGVSHDPPTQPTFGSRR